MAFGVTGKSELAYLIPQVWSSLMYDELRNQLLVANVFSRAYESQLGLKMGDVVKINQLVAPTAQILSDDKDSFEASVMSVNQFSVTVNKRAVASFEITDMALLQSQEFEAQLQAELVYAIRKKMEEDVIAALLPSLSAPDHDIAPGTPGVLVASDLAGMRTLLSNAKVPTLNRFFFASPSYYGDLLGSTNFISSDFVPAGSPASSGAFSSPLYGFTVMESDILGNDVGYAVHPSALQMVIQKDITVKMSDLHSQKKFGQLISADIVYGFSLFDNTRLVKISG